MKIPHTVVSKPEETLGQHMVRVRTQGLRKPLRTLREMAVEFDVNFHTLVSYMRHDPDSPKPRYTTGGKNTPRNTWVDPSEMRKWWNGRTQP